MKSTQKSHALPKPANANSHYGHVPVATGQSKPSGVTLDRDLAQGYIVFAFIYVLIGVLILVIYISRKRGSKGKQ